MGTLTCSASVSVLYSISLKYHRLSFKILKPMCLQKVLLPSNWLNTFSRFLKDRTISLEKQTCITIWVLSVGSYHHFRPAMSKVLGKKQQIKKMCSQAMGKTCLKSQLYSSGILVEACWYVCFWCRCSFKFFSVILQSVIKKMSYKTKECAPYTDQLF